MTATRRLAAILAADIAGYSRLMGADEEGTLAALKAIRRELADPKIEQHRGYIVKTTGDGLLVEFASVVDAVRCAVELQRAMAERNADMPKGKRIELRIGINLGDVIRDEGDEARAEFEHLAAQDFVDLAHDGSWTTCVAYLTEVCAALGDAARAELLHRLLLPYAGRILLLGGGVACAGASGRHLGLLCTTMACWSEAQQHFEDALAMNTHIGGRVLLAHTQHDYAAMLLARDDAGDRERATSLLRASFAERARNRHASAGGARSPPPRRIFRSRCARRPDRARGRGAGSDRHRPE
jgi:adenylate/guanylate cyclase family protein